MRVFFGKVQSRNVNLIHGVEFGLVLAHWMRLGAGSGLGGDIDFVICIISPDLTKAPDRGLDG